MNELLHQVRVTGFDTALIGFAERGGILYGGSAGAIVCGSDIDICAHMDENIVGLTDTTGLDNGMQFTTQDRDHNTSGCVPSAG